PRDGAAVELTGLAYAVICDLDQLHKKGHFQYEGVKKGQEKCFDLLSRWYEVGR
ncbi:hypothetical protein AB6A40_011797, partial [Gnathostoma spinigerum]